MDRTEDARDPGFDGVGMGNDWIKSLLGDLGGCIESMEERSDGASDGALVLIGITGIGGN